MRGDKVRVTTFVAVAPGDAFDVFTTETDLWWRRGRRFRGSDGEILFRDGRLVETTRDGAEQVIGRVLVWEPGARLVFEWRARNFEGDERTEVEVTFAPLRDGTQVTLEHRGFAALRPDHPVRHGEAVERFIARLGMWWGDLATSFRERAQRL